VATRFVAHGFRVRAAFTASVVLLVIALSAELALRGLSDGPLPREIRAMLALQNGIPHGRSVTHPYLGATMAPSQIAEVVTPDYRYILRTDQSGFANGSPWPDRVDVVVLGNSLITGAGVGLDGQFTTLLGEFLGAFAVLNLGTPGGGTEHQYRAYRLYGAPVQPKVVIATLWLVYEIDNSLAFHAWLEDPAGLDFSTHLERYFPAARIHGWRETVRAVTERSRIVTLIRQWSQSVRGITAPPERVVLADGEELLLSADEQGRLLKGWTRPGVIDVRQVVLEPLKRLQTEVESNGARFLVVLVPSKEELYAGKRLPQILEVVDAARTTLRSQGIETVDLYPAFQETAHARAAFFRADPHPNAEGHGIVAKALASAIRTGQER